MRTSNWFALVDFLYSWSPVCVAVRVCVCAVRLLFFTQLHCFKIRQFCADFLERNEGFFEKLTDEDLESHLERIRNPRDYPGSYMLNVLSKLYKKNFMIYEEVGEPPNQPVDNSSRSVVVLVSPDGMNFDCVYPKSHLVASALCQSIVYEILYKRVFKFGDCVDLAVSKMLHDKAYSKQRRSHLLNQTYLECYRMNDNEEDRPDEEQDAEAEIKKALAQGIAPFPYKVAKALDPLIYRNVEFDIWNEKMKEEMKNEQLVTPDIAPGVKCLVKLHERQKEPYVAHIQELNAEEGPVSVYVEELCTKYTVPLNCIEVLPVPAYKVWQNVRPHKSFPGFPKSPSQEKCKAKKKYAKKGTVPNSTCVLSSGSQLSEQMQVTTAPSQGTRCNLGKQLSRNDGARPNVQQYKWRNKQCDTGFFKSPQRGCQNQTEKISPRKKTCTSPGNFAQGSCEPETSHATAYAQPWERPNCMFQTPPIAIPVKAVDNVHRSQNQDIPVASTYNDTEWGEASSSAGSPSGFSPIPFLLTSVYPCEAVSCVPSEFSPINCDSNSPSPLTPPPQIPATQTPEEPVASAAQASRSPVTLFPCPMYSAGMLVMYGDGSVHPVSVAPWRQEYPSPDNAQGVPSVYYNGIGSPPNCISPPMTQWVPAPAPAAGYNTHWSATGSTFAVSSIPGEVAYPTALYSSPTWSPQSGFIVPPSHVAYQVPSGHPQLLPLPQPSQNAVQNQCA